ncbi:MAG: hypothetical protein P1U56_26630 [Saprospiraceae bacterium]|nr:hypothetical protein [Saprospiraceae bacterium]
MKNVTLFLLVFLTFTNVKAAEAPTFHLEVILPSEISIEDVISYELLEESTHSAIYEIHTVDNGVFYQVVSTAALKLLPVAAKYTCLGTIKNPVVCEYVYKVGSVLIELYGQEIKERATNFWKTRITGENGIATLISKSLTEAKDGQLAFEESAKKTDFPWMKPVINTYRSTWGKRLTGNGK